MTLLAQDAGFGAGVERSLEDLARLLPRIGYFLVLLATGVLLAALAGRLVTAVLQRAGFDRLVERGGVRRALAGTRYDAAGVLGRIAYYVVLLLVLSAAFAVFGPGNPVSVFLRDVVAFLPHVFVAVLVLVVAAAAAAAVKDLLTGLLADRPYGRTLAGVGSAVVVALGVFLALDQLQVAPAIVGGVFYALLALAVVPPIIAFGVGGIEPAREVIQELRETARRRTDDARRPGRRPADPPGPRSGARRPTAPAGPGSTGRAAPARPVAAPASSTRASAAPAPDAQATRPIRRRPDA